MPPLTTTARWRAMGSEVELVVVSASPGVGDALATLARAHLAELEARWSRFVPTSDISRLNLAQGRPIVVAPSTVRLVTAMVEAWRATAGRYDPTLLPLLVDLGYRASWHDPASVSAIAPGSTWRRGPGGVRVDVAAGVVELPRGVTLDAGGIGKGLAADLVVAGLTAAGALGALLSVGGDLFAAGEPPQPGGWLVDVADPRDAARALARVVLAGGGVATSGTDVRRWRSADGDAVHHLLDPFAGRPTGSGGPSDVVAATVVAGTGAWADALAKAALVDWPTSASVLDALGAGACVVTADGRSFSNRCWARYAVRPAGMVMA